MWLGMGLLLLVLMIGFAVYAARYAQHLVRCDRQKKAKIEGRGGHQGESDESARKLDRIIVDQLQKAQQSDSKRADMGAFVSGARYAVISAPGAKPKNSSYSAYDYWHTVVVQSNALIDCFPPTDENQGPFADHATNYSFACVWVPGIEGCCGQLKRPLNFPPDVWSKLMSKYGKKYKKTTKAVHEKLITGYKHKNPNPPCDSCRWFDFWAVNVMRCDMAGQELLFSFLDEPLYPEQPRFRCTAKGHEGVYYVGIAQQIELEWAQDMMGFVVRPIRITDIADRLDKHNPSILETHGVHFIGDALENWNNMPTKIAKPDSSTIFSCLKVSVSFFQVFAIFPSMFPSVPWPVEFIDLCGIISIVNIDFVGVFGFADCGLTLVGYLKQFQAIVAFLPATLTSFGLVYYTCARYTGEMRSVSRWQLCCHISKFAGVVIFLLYPMLCNK